MPSGKKSKQARRAAALKPPPVQSKGAPRRRQANPRVLAIGGAVAALAIVAIVLGFVFSRGNGSGIPKGLPTFGSIANGLPGSADVQTMYGGIPQNGLVLGKPSAHVRMVIYIDLQCPLCQQFELTSMPTIVDLLGSIVKPTLSPGLRPTSSRTFLGNVTWPLTVMVVVIFAPVIRFQEM